MASIEEIRHLLGEPRFLWSDNTCWVRLEEELGVKFPSDFREFSDLYGPVRINRQVTIGHPGVERGNLGIGIRSTIEAWQDAPEDELPYPVGTGPGELLPWGSAASGETIFFRIPAGEGEEWSVGVYESDEGGYYEHAITFAEWMLSYLRGEDVTVSSRQFAPEDPFFEQIS